jgi:hypothetical protein
VRRPTCLGWALGLLPPAFCSAIMPVLATVCSVAASCSGTRRCSTSASS